MDIRTTRPKAKPVATLTQTNRGDESFSRSDYRLLGLGMLVGLPLVLATFIPSSTTYEAPLPMGGVATTTVTENAVTLPPPPVLDQADYDRRLLVLANYPSVPVATATASSSVATTTSIKPNTVDRPWPVKDLPYPLPGAILPFQRIVAYYGNFYSKGMGILGEYSEEVMLAKFREQIAAWEAADPDTPVMPAIDYIAVTAQAAAGPDGDYNLRMPDDQIDHALALAKAVNGIVILEVQVGQANLMTEIKRLEKYLVLPEVHLAIDPEFRMVGGGKPGEVVGTVSAVDVNEAVTYLSALVKEHNLTPKVLVVHRFTQNMVRNATAITPTAEVQVVIDMDGWGSPAKKKNTYDHIVAPEPVQFTGFKVFYKNDLKPPSTRLMLPAELLTLQPRPIFIQYQ